MAWPGASPEEHGHRQALLQTLVRWCLFVAPIATGTNVAVYLRDPIWPALVLVVASAAMLSVAAWSLPRVRRGELRFTTRAMLALFLAMVTINALTIDERVKAMTLLGLPCIILLAIALEPPALALGWACAAVAVQVASVVLPWVTALPTMRLSTVLVWLFDFGTFEFLLLITLLARSITSHLRQALSASEHARASVEKSNARLAEERAALEKAQADLADSTPRSRGEQPRQVPAPGRAPASGHRVPRPRHRLGTRGAGQRHRHRAAPLREDLRPLPAPPPPERVRGDRARPRHRAEGGRGARRQGLGGVGAESGEHVPFHPPQAAGGAGGSAGRRSGERGGDLPALLQSMPAQEQVGRSGDELELTKEERIAAAARDMDALVADLLAYSRAQGRT